MVTDNFPDISFIDDSTIEDVLTQMINDFQSKYKEITKKEVSLAQSDPYRLMMYACAVQIYQAMQYADYAGKVSFLKYARGDYLDNLAAIRGVHRLQATAATTILKFTIDTPLQSVVGIPAGTRATNGNDIFFATDEYAEIKAGETTVSVSATCTEEGSRGYLPMVSPTIRAHLRCGLSGPLFSSIIEKSTRRCTGFKPSLTSGNARCAITLMA